MRKIAIVMAVLGLGAACADVPEPVEASSGSAGTGGYVTYKYTDDVGEAAAHAAAYCGKYRKRAWLRHTARLGDDNVATFDCR